MFIRPSQLTFRLCIHGDLKGDIKQIIAGYAYTNFQEMYQRAVKIARIINETEIENRGKGQVRRNLAPEDPIVREG